MKGLFKNVSIIILLILSIVFIPNNLDDLSIGYEDLISLNDYNGSNTVIPSEINKYKTYEYVIDKYNVDVVVNENNTFDITETITAYFNVSKHGILRTIPLKNSITRLDGSTSKNRVRISNLSVDNEYTVSIENGNYNIKIGSESRTLIGKQTYVIKYNYNIGKDPLRNSDEFYYNIIGTNWDTVIGNVTFNIIMPKEFDSSSLGFSSGTYGLTSNNKVKYLVNGNKISGSYNGILNAEEALTVRIELPEGYFVGAKNYYSFIDIMMLLPILLLGISIFLWYKYGRDDQVVETVEFYPPNGLNSLEVGLLYKGKANNQDVTSLLIYLANKGYIKITETNEKKLFLKSKGFKITKLKEYDGSNENEELFLKGLFTKRASIYSLHDKSSQTSDEDNDEVTLKDLKDNFYVTMIDILLNVNSEENINKIFDENASSKIRLVRIMIMLTYCLITIPPFIAYGATSYIIFAIIFPPIGFSIMFPTLIGDTDIIYLNGIKTLIGKIVFGLTIGALIGGVSWAILVLPVLSQDLTYFIGYMIGLVCVLGMYVCIKYLPKRTPYGNEMLGKIRGFKNFLNTAEKDRLEAMVNQNPSYFYDILPYTYVLGVSDKWIKKFESMSLQSPSWYDSPTEFDTLRFGTFMNDTMKSARNAMSYNPSSSSGDFSSGGSSGGGFSGGGSGGGGGSSW